MKKIHAHNKRGNVLFLILIAVALFAALSYAMTRSSRSGSGDAGKETLALQAAQITQYATGLENSIMRMRLSNGCSDTNISFTNPFVADYEHPVPPADQCKVFHPQGGGWSYTPPKPEWLDTAQSAEPHYGELIFTGQTCVAGVGTGSDFTCWNDGDLTNQELLLTNQELLLIVPWIKKDLCILLNEKLGVTNPGGNPPQDGGSIWSTLNIKFIGTYSENAIPETLGGIRSACMEGNTFPVAQTYHFYHVLIAR
ncbi:MAG: hypothetical protein CO093_09045 [Alphaproteobacteria bacterium CG_4_9_14_3_um_filter_47_13]|nr:MAG: hypothetical protein CO093_09045 [Alphaproteobacteria bacterium CG_4_9_14_3_um_filter_47_13]